MRRPIRSLILILTVLALLLAVAPAAYADSQVHTVQAGETLFRISLMYGVSVPAIQAANGITGTRIYAGQQLIIPDPNAPLPAPAAGSSGVHVVQRGETLFLIGLRYGLPWTTIAQANGLSGERIYTGQTLVIPGAGAPAAPPEQPPQLEVPPEPPAEAPQPAPEPQPEQPSAGPRTHVVQRGETLFLIGLKYGLTWTTIAQANGLTGEKIYVGQVLTIPEKGAAPAPAPEPPAEPAAPAPPPGAGKRFLVDLSEQRLYAFENDTLVRTTLISSGRAQTPTVIGTYKIYLRYESARMRGPGYDLQNVPYVMYFYRGYGLHGTYWHNNFGTPMSHGCVNMPTPEAEWAFYWSDYGTPVTVQW
jgi:LysM repeat protein